MSADNQSISASVSASITEGEAGGSISLERCSAGRDQEKACAARFKAVPPGVMTFDGLDEGWAVIRVWRSAGVSPSLYKSAANTTRGIESLGSRVETITETVTFSGSAQAALGKGYALTSGPAILARTPFLAAGGGPAPAPAYSNGMFKTSRPAYGTLVVSYQAVYTAYKVYYGLPEWVIDRIFKGGGNMEDATIPPVVVMAYDGGVSATLQIERRIMQVKPAPCENNEWVTDPGASTIVKYKVFTESQLDEYGNPKPNADYLTSVTYLKHVEYCKAEPTRRRAQSFPKPKADNIQIISVEQGSI